MKRNLRKTLRFVIALLLSAALIVLSLGGCGKRGEDMLMGGYAASDNVVNTDIGAMKPAAFSPLLSEWFLCDITKDQMSTDYVFDAANSNRKGSVFVIDRTDNKLLFGYRMFDAVYPASVTKLMTALVVLEHCDPKEVVTISKTVAAMTRGSTAELKEGDLITVYNLLIVLLILSANNAALALAEHVAGSEEEFVKLMNQEMDRLGANDTTFANASGLHADRHQTTAFDMYVVYQECTKYAAFREIAKMTSGEYEYTNAAGEQCVRAYKTSNRFQTGKYPYPEYLTILGGKAGSTERAGFCLIEQVKSSETGKEYLLGIFFCETEEKLYTKMNELMETYCK